jgi:hypothetical protein
MAGVVLEIRYSNRIDTATIMPDLLRTLITAGQPRVLSFGTPHPHASADALSEAFAWPSPR